MKTFTKKSVAIVLAILMAFSTMVIGTMTSSAADSSKVYFVASGNAKNWARYNAYMWNEPNTSSNNGWPGKTMTKESGTASNGAAIYSINIFSGANKIIFDDKQPNNDSGTKTSDLDLKAGQYYDFETGQWVADPQNIPKPDFVSTEWYLPGEFNSWAFGTASNFTKASSSDSVAHVKLTLEANKTYQFGVCTSGWSTKYTGATITSSNCKDVTLTNGASANNKITTTVAGEYDFAFNTSTHKLTVTYPSKDTDPTDPSKPVTVYFKDTLNWGGAYVYFYTDAYWNDNKENGGTGSATGGSFEAGPFAMTKVEGTDNVYSYEYNGKYSGYISFTKESQKNYDQFYKTEAVYRGDFDPDLPMFTPSTESSGTYNQTVYYSDGNWSEPELGPVGPDEISLKYYCADPSHGWNDQGEKFTTADKGKTYTLSIPYGGKSLSCQLYNDTTSKWLGLNDGSKGVDISTTKNGSYTLVETSSRESKSLTFNGTDEATISFTYVASTKTVSFVVETKEPDEKDYTVVYNYNDGTEDVQLTKTVKTKETDAEKIANEAMPSIKNPYYTYSIKSASLADKTVTVELQGTKKEYTVTLNGSEVGKYGYKEEATVQSDSGTDTTFVIDGKAVATGTSYTFYVTGDTDITTTVEMEAEDLATLILEGITVSDDKVSMELLASALTDNFGRMGVAFSTSTQENSAIEAAVKEVTTGTGKNSSNTIAVHNSKVDASNVSGQYQFAYAPFLATEKAAQVETLYFYAYVVTDDGKVVVSEAVEVNLSNALA